MFRVPWCQGFGFLFTLCIGFPFNGSLKGFCLRVLFKDIDINFKPFLLNQLWDLVTRVINEVSMAITPQYTVAISVPAKSHDPPDRRAYAFPKF